MYRLGKSIKTEQRLPEAGWDQVFGLVFGLVFGWMWLGEWGEKRKGRYTHSSSGWATG